MMPGDIVENYQGAFAKVILLSEGGLTHLSAWVRTPELAEQETVSVSFLNAFGLSQVLKDGVNAGKSEDFVIVESALESEPESPKAGKAKAAKAE